MELEGEHIPEQIAEQPVDSSDGARCYLVTGPQRVHGTAPGDTFTAALDPGQEAFLIEVGHIETVRPESDIESATSAE